jgi:hypothetical protein
MKQIFTMLFALTSIVLISYAQNTRINEEDVIIENDQIKLIITKEGTAKSLLFKSTNEECLIEGKKIPICAITQDRPYQNEIKLAYPTMETTFKANSIRREGDKLIVGFELIPWEAIINLQITSQYIRFSLEDFHLNGIDKESDMTVPPISEMWFLQLPIRNRSHFGDWLNVVWDNKLAINVLGTDRYARIDYEEGEGYRILKAGVVDKVKLKGVGAALITCSMDKLLDNIGRVEEDYNLPHGVNSRRNELYHSSYYWSGDVNPNNVDQHIKYAKLGGFRAFLIYYPAFLEGRGYRNLGDYRIQKSKYPNGLDDLIAMLNKIKSAGMVPGLHFLHSHIGRDSKYITPIPDPRLNLLKIFTLADPLAKNDTTIYVAQNPANSAMADNRRVLKIGTELLSYKNYTTSRPYKFTGCVRGIDKTTVNSQPAGFLFGLLDVSEFGAQSVYIDQNTDLQEEIAQKLADIYKAGFQFVYFDGSEGVNAPFWFNVSAAQWKVYCQLKPEPLYAEGAAKTHFSWHMLSRGNAFDIFKPELLKESIRKFPAEEAPRMRDNFTQINFGWLGYWVPDKKTIGTQPDMLEYVTSRAAAWDCPVSIHANLGLFAAHPRTADNLEVLRRWEEVRAQHWLTEEQKLTLRNLAQEHTLLLNDKKEFELVPYDQIMDVAHGSREVRAYTFKRHNDMYVVYWHISGNKQLELPLHSKDITLLESLGKEIQVNSSPNGDNTILPVGNRRFIKTSKLTKDELITAFKNAKIMD